MNPGGYATLQALMLNSKFLVKSDFSCVVVHVYKHMRLVRDLLWNRNLKVSHRYSRGHDNVTRIEHAQCLWR